MTFATRTLMRCLSMAAISTPVLAQDINEPEVNPTSAFAGVDANGRIERPVLPADIKNPDRWRYTPPGRIVPGNPLERFLISTFFSPLIFRESDVGTGGGVAFTDIDFRNQDYREFANVVLTYTSEGQQAYGMNWQRWINHRKLENGGVIREDRSILGAGAGYSKTLTRRFYGLGSRTFESGESSYTEALTRIGFGIRQTYPDPGDNILLTGGLSFQRHALSRGHVSSVPSTDAAFSGLFARGDDVNQIWVDLGIAYDSRDSIHQPYSGYRVGFSTRTAAIQTDHQFGGSMTLDASTVFKLPALLHEGGDVNEENPPTDVLAIGAFVTDSHGVLPFYSLPSLGGNILRGYGPNRFTDRAAAYGSIEYRFGVIPRGFNVSERIRVERINMALFWDFGTVANDVDQLAHNEYLYSVGTGVRILFSREASFRIDYGVSDEGGVVTVGFGNSI